MPRIVEGAWSPPGGKFSRNNFMDADYFPSWRMLHCRNVGVYRSAFSYSRPPVEMGPEGWVDVPYEKVLLYGGFYMDIDRSPLDYEGWREAADEARRIVRALQVEYQINPPQVRISFSGSKGIHLYIPPEVMGIAPAWNLNEAFRKLAEKIKTSARSQHMDLRVYDRRRVMRVMNSIHHETGLYKTPLEYEELKLGLDEIGVLATQPRLPVQLDTRIAPKAQHELKSILKEAGVNRRLRKNGAAPIIDPKSPPPPCIQELSINTVSEGGRNSAAFILASHLLQRGVDEEEAKMRLLNWASSYTDPELKEREVVSVVESVYRHGYAIGCRGIEELATCFKEQCSIYRKKHALPSL